MFVARAQRVGFPAFNQFRGSAEACRARARPVKKDSGLNGLGFRGLGFRVGFRLTTVVSARHILAVTTPKTKTCLSRIRLRNDPKSKA